MNIYEGLATAMASTLSRELDAIFQHKPECSQDDVLCLEMKLATQILENVARRAVQSERPELAHSVLHHAIEILGACRRAGLDTRAATQLN